MKPDSPMLSQAMPTGQQLVAPQATAPGALPSTPSPAVQAQADLQTPAAQDDEALLARTTAGIEQAAVQLAQDPYQLAQRIERLKAEYINTKYGKNIKLSEA